MKTAGALVKPKGHDHKFVMTVSCMKGSLWGYLPCEREADDNRDEGQFF